MALFPPRPSSRHRFSLGGALARTFDFYAGDTAVFPDNSGKRLSTKIASSYVVSLGFNFSH